MVAGAEKGALGNADVVLKGDRGKVEEPAFFAKPDVIAENEFPRKGDFDVGFDDDAATDARAEAAQDPTFQTGELERAELEKGEADEEPKEFAEPAGASVRIRSGK